MVYAVKKKKRKNYADLVFYVSVLFFPVFMFMFNTLAIDTGSVIMAFQKYDFSEGGKKIFCLFDNFKDVISKLSKDRIYLEALTRSAWSYLLSLAITTVLPMTFHYYIWKNHALSEFFKVILFLPSIISGIITMTIFRFIANRLVPDLLFRWFGMEVVGLTSNPATSYQAILFYAFFMGMGSGLLVHLGTMNAVDPCTIEAGKLDGTNALSEFWHIILPVIYRVYLIGFITGIPSIFTNDYGLYGFFHGAADPSNWTFGYCFLIETLGADEFQYPFYSAWGLMMSVIVVPVTLFFKNLIYKHGPSED